MVPKDYVGCWQTMNCGREPGGRNAETLGVCIVARQPGSTCWLVAGHSCTDPQTLCFRLRNGRKTCYDCKVYAAAHQEAVALASNRGGGGLGPARLFGGWVDAIEY
jgi:hypothetical protein